MSYRGRSVYCSFCGERGHNRTGCPKRKQYIKDNPDSWEAIKEQRRVQRRKETKAKGGRKCSYCLERGHTARTCETKKQDRVRLVTALAKERSEGLKRLNELGWGIGALFEKANRWTNSKNIYMVDKIEWKHWTDSDMVTLGGINVEHAATPEHDWRNPKHISVTISLHQDDKTPICPRHIEQTAPEGFVNGTMYDESQYFPKGMKRAYVHQRVQETGKV